MNLTIVINTCAGSKDSRVLDARSSFGMKIPYKLRADKLRKVLSEYAQTGEKMIVVGEWHPGEGYIYLEVPGPNKNPSDAAAQRRAACRQIETDYALFLNDDHYLPPRQLGAVLASIPDGGVLAFNRCAWLVDLPHTVMLETGWPDYVMGHACAMHRSVWERVPWSMVEGVKYKQDEAYTAGLLAANIPIRYDGELCVYDIECGEIPE